MTSEKMINLLVQTPTCTYQGYAAADADVFLGIPYASQPIGARRFIPSRINPNVASFVDARSHGLSALQLKQKGRSPLFSWLDPQTTFSEECLVLNVYKPRNLSEKAPVIVYFHGGAFAFGSSSACVLDGSKLAAGGAVMVVTINHRLNIFGFLGTAAVSDSGLASPNLGMGDLITALKWVQQNCEYFGGDSTNVTVMGQSGGAGKVALLMHAPEAKGLFHRAIVQSSANGFHMQNMDLTERAYMYVQAELANNRVGSAFLQQCEGSDLLSVYQRMMLENNGYDYFRPVLDGVMLTQERWTPLDFPVMLGYTSDEANFYLMNELESDGLSRSAVELGVSKFLGLEKSAGQQLTSQYAAYLGKKSPITVFSRMVGDYIFKFPTVGVADALAAESYENLYLYEFAYRSSVSRDYIGVPHTMELPFVFGNLIQAKALIDRPEEAAELSDMMMRCWARFAKTGNPQVSGCPEWPSYDAMSRSTMVFDSAPHVVTNPLEFERVAFEHMSSYIPGSPIRFCFG